MIKRRDKEGFNYVFIDEIPIEYQGSFIMFLLGAYVPAPINNRKRAFWGDYYEWYCKLNRYEYR